MRKFWGILILLVLEIIGFFGYLGTKTFFEIRQQPNGDFTKQEIILAILIPMFALLYPMYLILRKKEKH